MRGHGESKNNLCTATHVNNVTRGTKLIEIDGQRPVLGIQQHCGVLYSDVCRITFPSDGKIRGGRHQFCAYSWMEGQLRCGELSKDLDRDSSCTVTRLTTLQMIIMDTEKRVYRYNDRYKLRPLEGNFREEFQGEKNHLRTGVREFLGTR